VRDASLGIPQECEAHLIDAFFITKAHGIGVGLSICRSIAEAHGGRIEAVNNENCGVTFRLIRPQIDVAVSSPAV
jgi:C4-dicarboxylate-specific signal transduction histidine kinase